jgi:hypothetical protein
MKRIAKSTLVAICALGVSVSASAGNKDRVGQSGAPELLINPWARTGGVFGSNASYVGGLEAMKSNIAGLALDSATEVGLTHVNYLSGTGVNINDLAVAQPIGNGNVIALNIMSMSFGDISATDYFNPDGYGTYHPQYLNVQLGFARQFSTHFNAGFAMTYVSEQISNINALGLAFDGGVQYIAGKQNNFHLGVTLRNLGTNMRFSGSGFAINIDQPQTSPSYTISGSVPSDKFPLPTYLNLSTAYDFYLDKNHLSADSMPMHRLTVMGAFTSNSFINDYIGVGAEYMYKNRFGVRAAYRYEKGIGNTETTNTMYVGFSAGATVQTRLGESGPFIALDYAFMPTQRPANGVHMLSLRFTRGATSKKDD